MTEKRQKYIEAHYGSHSVGFPVESAVPSSRYSGWTEACVHPDDWAETHRKIKDFATKAGVNFEVVGWDDVFHLPPVFELTERGQNMPGAEWSSSTDKSTKASSAPVVTSNLPFRVKTEGSTVGAFGSQQEAFEYAAFIFAKDSSLSVTVALVAEAV